MRISADVGQESELERTGRKAIKTGASKLYIEDLKEEFVNDYVFPTIKAGAVYENKYLLGTSFARPIIGKRLVEIAKAEGADAICHGCTEKEMTRFGLNWQSKHLRQPCQLSRLSGHGIWKSRDDEIEYAEAHNIPLKLPVKPTTQRQKLMASFP